METGNIKINVLLTAVALVLIVEVVLGFIAPENAAQRLMVLAAARILETAGICLIVMFLGGGLAIIGLEPSNMWVGSIRGLFWSAGFGLMVVLTGLLLNLFQLNPVALIKSGLPEKTSELVMIFIVGGIIGPVAEEVFFRGICYGYFRRWGVIIAVVLTTAIFVSAHSISSTVPILQMIGGILFALSYEMEKNLMVPITIHVTGNLSIFTLSAWI